MKNQLRFLASVAAWLALFGGTATMGRGASETGASQTEARTQPFIVTTAWLAEHLNDHSLIILQLGPQEIYESGHIPGAQFLSFNELSTPHGEGLTLELPAVEQLVSRFEKRGVSNDSRIILCAGNDWITAPGRAFMTLDYMGLGSQSSILDGGLPAWLAENRPVTKEIREVAHGSLSVHLKPNTVVDAAWVSGHLKQPGVAILDARTPEFYSGKDSGDMPRAGHIPGAKSIPFTSLVDGSDKFKSAAALAELFHGAGVKEGDTVVTYCHIGMQASLLYFVARSLGYEAHLYDGSWEDWSARKDLPVERSDNHGSK